MQDKIFNLISAAPWQFEVSEIAERYFKITSGPDKLINNTIKKIVLDDVRFSIDEIGKVGLSENGQTFNDLMNTTFVAVDLETTGTITPKDSIVEIAAMKIEEGVISDSFETLINPGRYIPYNITYLTGITNKMVTECPVIEDVMPEFLEFLGDAVFVAHNYSFDLRFVNSELYKMGQKPITNPTLCTYQLGRKLVPELRKHNLTIMAEHFGINNHARHRAGGDAAACAGIFLKMIKKLPAKNIFTLEELLNFA